MKHRCLLQRSCVILMGNNFKYQQNLNRTLKLSIIQHNNLLPCTYLECLLILAFLSSTLVGNSEMIRVLFWCLCASLTNLYLFRLRLTTFLPSNLLISIVSAATSFKVVRMRIIKHFSIIEQLKNHWNIILLVEILSIF